MVKPIRKRGRPPLPQDARLNSLLTLAVTEEEADSVMRQAVQQHTTVSQLLRATLLKKQTLPLVPRVSPLPKAKQTRTISTVTYLIKDEHERVKVGITCMVTFRLSDLQNGNGDRLTLVTQCKGNMESAFKQRFKSHHIRGEWYRWDDDMKPWLESQTHAPAQS